MAKVLTDKEGLEIVRRVVLEDEFDCADSYRSFLEDLGCLIARHFGGRFIGAEGPLSDTGSDAETRHCMLFAYNGLVPANGGVYVEFDTDKSLEEWKNEQ